MIHLPEWARPITDSIDHLRRTITMPPRLNKRQLREQEELSALQTADDGPNIDNEETPGVDKPTMVRFVPVIV